jgi:hypothetical protein
MHPARLHRRCHQPADASAVRREREHLRLILRRHGLIWSGMASRWPDHVANAAARSYSAPRCLRSSPPSCGPV